MAEVSPVTRVTVLNTKGAARLRLLWAALFVLVAPPLRAQAQGEAGPAVTPPARVTSHDAAPRARTARISESIELDGRLDEAHWRGVPAITEFTQTEPVDGAAATERTEVYIVYDDDAIYVGARMWDSSGKVSSRLARRDSYVSDSDWFYVMFDSHHDHLNAYQFSVNPAGVKRDERASGGDPDESWDAIWDVATTIDAEGWTAELRIPFSQLRFSNAEVQTWGLQLSRRISRKSEMHVLSHTPKSERGGIARYAHIDGLTQLRSGRKVELQPYAMSRAEYLAIAPGNPYRDGSDMFAGAGIDMKYRLAPSLTLDATINPDFGQVEQDPAVVNLTAFETSLNERRPFFIEGSDVFRFGAGGQGGQGGIFNSRRIGRAPQGSLPSGVRFSDRPDAATILGAAKLTGRTANGLSLGVLAALTDEEKAAWTLNDGSTGGTIVEPRSGYLVGRVRQDLRAGQTSIGGIATLMHRDLDDPALELALRSDAIAGGIDFKHQFFSRMWAVEGYATFSHVAGSTGSMLRTQLSSARYYNRPDADYLAVDSTLTSLQGYSARLTIAKEAGLHWRAGANVSAVSPGYEINDGGFQTTVDRIGTDANIGYVENTPGRIFRNYRLNANVSGDWNFGGDNVIARGSMSWNGQLTNYWGGNINYTHSLDAWDDRLTRGGPVALDPGGYHVSGNINSDGRRRMSGRINASYSSGTTGSWHQTTSGNLTIRGGENWSVSFGPRFDRNLSVASYLSSSADSLMTSTYGRRYFFAPLRQRTMAMDTRLTVNMTTNLSLELFAQPFVSSGDYGTPSQLRAERTFDFQRFGADIGTLSYDAEERSYRFDPDGEAGPARTFTLSDRDFTTRSLRGNAVMRWEWSPGSTLFLVWQQRRSGSDAGGNVDFGNDVGAIFREKPENVFVMKVSYWLNL